MRIISSFHDYYDSVQKYGQDDILFIRNKHEIFSSDDIPRLGFTNVDCQKCIIGFCGKVYPCIRFHYSYGYITRIPVVNFIYNPDDFDTVMAAAYAVRAIKHDELTDYYRHLNFYHKHCWVTRRKVDSWFEKAVEFVGSLNIKALKENPIWLIESSPYYQHKTMITINPSLREYEFFRVKDTYTAYQELNMWLSNKARPEKPIPPISDIDMRDCKGFDKYSFKKDKQNGKTC